MNYTNKQKSILSLIDKANKTVFTPNELYESQGKAKVFSRKAITLHLSNLASTTDALTRVRRGQYMTAQTVSTITGDVSKNPIIESIVTNPGNLPAFLAHEDIEKLIEWKNISIANTTDKIDNLKLKITKLENQKEQLNSIKKKFC
tara:strand:+ start:225 stop:662 length:438 start_codon:yes stop_codon:yes gene_type:complete